MAKKNALGRGLGALIDNAENVKTTVEETRKAAAICEIEIEKIEANPYQPRTEFDEEALRELAQSIEQIGIVQPITVREIDGGKYQLIAGERRFRASKLANLKKLPAYIRRAKDDTMLELALVENIQRENLDAMEIAISYQRLLEECKLTQEELSERVGKKRTTVTNYLRLLKLPAEIQLGIKAKQLSMGHARALLGLEDSDTQLMVFDQILKYDFSVRRVEEVVREINNPDTAVKEAEKKEEKEATQKLKGEYDQLAGQLADYFRTKVQLKRSTNGKGKIVIPFKSDEDLERILGVLDNMN
jgi:ParB family chromosome partitioning protein